ncbi:RNA polymerase sigma-70 factor [Parapedobacter sp. 10938]|uniref:RNA polymerase sigma-70 factor n=1 Tax=Parapedobacter flavus TaxID=3110225 RepID=UPI002DB5F68A|nr:RNA polymerase sigma-70 factor [Parapedobacter sp. 10938]MEC3878233.1 RNA polymerase sigma-70 factor [Parapedobacter sp. 10938]
MSKNRAWSDEELIAALADSDQFAFTEIYERYWKKLLAISLRHTEDQTLAEEIVQEVFIALWNRRNQVVIRSLDGYLATAIKFGALKSIYKARRHQEIEQTNVYHADQQLDEEKIDARFLKEYVDGIIEQLPEKCKLVFRYSREEYKSNREIAQALSISEKAVEAHITRALRFLRLNLRKAGIFCLPFFFF